MSVSEGLSNRIIPPPIRNLFVNIKDNGFGA